MKSAREHQTRLPELDGIRGLAISLVLFQHFVVDSIIPGTSRIGDFIKYNFTLGRTGVDLFFVLSGFLIGGILLDNRGSDSYFKSFYIRRICRIIPLYFLFLLAFVSFRFLLRFNSAQSWYNDLFLSGVSLWTYATFTQSFFEVLKYGTALVMAGWLTPTWSLAIEEQFYLLLPAVVRIVRPVLILPACLIVFFAHASLYSYLWLYHSADYYYASLVVPLRCDALLLGVVCACLVRSPNACRWISNHHEILRVLLGVLLIGAVWSAPKFDSSNWEIERDILFYPWIALLYACILILAVTNQPGIISRVTRFAPLRKLGVIAYGIFLFHIPINGLLHALILGRGTSILTLPDGAITMAALLVTLIFANLSWRFAEKPIVTWGHSFSYNPRKVTDK